MTTKEVLAIEVHVDDGREPECARALRDRLRPSQWRILRQLAAEITALGESEAAGSRVLVVPAAELEADLPRELRVRLAGRE